MGEGRNKRKERTSLVVFLLRKKTRRIDADIFVFLIDLYIN